MGAIGTGSGERHQRPPPSDPGGIRRVQIGCGPEHIREEWWNVDIRPFLGIDQQLDVTKPWPWRDVLDYVYGEHFLEHVDLCGAVDFLVEAGKSLREGGRIRLSTPSLEWVLSTHFDFANKDEKHAIEQTFTINRAFYGWGHRFLYSKNMLEDIITSVGYEGVQFFSYGKSNDAELCGLEKHPYHGEAHGFPCVWIVEACRGKNTIEANGKLLSLIEEKFDRYVKGGH